MSNIAVPDKPVFKLEMEKTTEETPGSYQEFNPRFARLLENDAYLKDAISKFTKTAVLAAGQTSVGFGLEGVQENSIIKFYAVDTQLNYDGIDIDKDNGRITVFFPPQKKDVTIKMVVSDGAA